MMVPITCENDMFWVLFRVRTWVNSCAYAWAPTPGSVRPAHALYFRYFHLVFCFFALSSRFSLRGCNGRPSYAVCDFFCLGWSTTSVWQEIAGSRNVFAHRKPQRKHFFSNERKIFLPFLRKEFPLQFGSCCVKYYPTISNHMSSSEGLGERVAVWIWKRVAVWILGKGCG